MKDKLVYIVALGVLWFLNMLPVQVAFFLGRNIGLALYMLDRKHRKTTYRNLSNSFPHKTASEIRNLSKKVFINLGIMLVETSRVFKCQGRLDETMVSYEGLENVKNALSKGKGILLMTAHMGNWEVGALGYGSLFPFNFVVRPIDNPYIDNLVRKVRGTNGSGIIPKKKSMRKIMNCLKNNETVGILMDQNQVREEGVFVRFFGRPACTTPAVSLLALRTGAAVLPAFAVREAPGKIKIIVQKEVSVETSGDKKLDAIKYTQAFTGIIEEFVSQYTDQWFWVHNRWKTRPLTEEG